MVVVSESTLGKPTQPTLDYLPMGVRTTSTHTSTAGIVGAGNQL